MSVNLIVIGMPGSGKSTMGRQLARALKWDFVDTDKIIEQQQNMPLQQVVNRYGLVGFRKLEEKTISQISVTESVIATGGSAIYSTTAMRHLATLGPILFLQISMTTLLHRVSYTDARGLMRYPCQTLQNLYFQRMPLYLQYASFVVDNNRPLNAWHFDRVLAQVQSHIRRSKQVVHTEPS